MFNVGRNAINYNDRSILRGYKMTENQCTYSKFIGLGSLCFLYCVSIIKKKKTRARKVVNNNMINFIIFCVRQNLKIF